MTAPLVVVQMINFQYYFSATDSWAYGKPGPKSCTTSSAESA